MSTPSPGKDYRRAISFAATSVVILVFAYVAFRQWREGGLGQLTLPVAPFLLSATGMAGLAVLLGLFWCRQVRLMTGAPVPVAALLHAHFVAWLARYIPGKISQLAGKIVLGENAGIRRGPLLASVYYENALFIGSGLSITLLCLGPSFLKGYFAPALSELWLIWLALLMISFLLVSVTALPMILRRLLRGREGSGLVIRPGSALLLFLVYHLAHLAAGAGFYFLLGAIAPESGISFLVATGILTAAHIGGILALIVPAGLGVREAILALLLSGYLPTEQAVMVSLVTRAWSILADGYILVMIPVVRFVRRRAPS